MFLVLVFCCWFSHSAYSRAVYQWEVEGSLSQYSIYLLCLVFVSVSSCGDIPPLYETLVQLILNSGWDGIALV
jgi:hypothetical protein